MKALRVLKAGLSTTVQDHGRRGFQKYGVPVAGAMDLLSLRLANLLAGNLGGEACLETTIVGPRLQFAEERDFAVTGAPAPVLLDGERVPMNRTLHAGTDSVLDLLQVESGARSYIAFAGGLDLTPILGSRSTYARARLGGLEGRRLREGDELPLRKPAPRVLETRVSPPSLTRRPEPTVRIRVLAGPEAPLFGDEGLETFLGAEYMISGDSDRMGYRLEGPSPARVDSGEMISSAVNFGTIQVPPDGRPIVMMADRHTSGGYPRIANVIAVDLGLLAQVPPGGSIRFELVEPSESRSLLLEEERALAELEEAFSRGSFPVGREELPARVGAKRGLKRYRITIDDRVYDVVVAEL